MEDINIHIIKQTMPKIFDIESLEMKNTLRRQNNKLKQEKSRLKTKNNGYKTKVRVLKRIIENPLETAVQIAKDLDLHVNTINNVVKGLRTKELRLAAMDALVAQDCEVQQKALDLIEGRMTNKPDEINTSDLVKISEFSFKRQQLIDGKPTENINQNIVVKFTGLDDIIN